MELSRLIYLIGLPGSGKSSVGKILSSSIEYDFIDLDEWIEKNEKSSIKEIFAVKGESYFRDLETRALQMLSEKINSGTIISTGGGTPCYNDNLKILKNTGLLIYLKADVDVLVKRIENNIIEKDNRPLFNTADIESKYKALIKDRRLFYEDAHLIVDTGGLNEKEIAELILSEMNQ
ncbi:shikimate kinase [Mangrovivirga sp. M17]|uniref:Shikimate kinase n=1 Tax=Mangrovivirga halotolerans TaxID=2993936 RepID=A0ABT3RP85_9BACT|nr:shikimate kinase [Mangrovivirga halotolerans]MCX2743415.1 shikimate kinase [Mangrovivirga halotolerans]